MIELRSARVSAPWELAWCRTKNPHPTICTTLETLFPLLPVTPAPTSLQKRCFALRFPLRLVSDTSENLQTGVEWELLQVRRKDRPAHALQTESLWRGIDETRRDEVPCSLLPLLLEKQKWTWGEALERRSLQTLFKPFLSHDPL